jgi:hypothetical protein
MFPLFTSLYKMEDVKLRPIVNYSQTWANGHFQSPFWGLFWIIITNNDHLSSIAFVLWIPRDPGLTVFSIPNLFPIQNWYNSFVLPYNFENLWLCFFSIFHSFFHCSNYCVGFVISTVFVTLLSGTWSTKKTFAKIEHIDLRGQKRSICFKIKSHGFMARLGL